MIYFKLTEESRPKKKNWGKKKEFLYNIVLEIGIGLWNTAHHNRVPEVAFYENFNFEKM